MSNGGTIVSSEEDPEDFLGRPLLPRIYIDRRQHAGRQEPVPTTLFVLSMECKDLMSSRKNVQKASSTFAEPDEPADPFVSASTPLRAGKL